MPTLSQRLLTLLQFTRLALVFTAISNGWAAMLLQAKATAAPLEPAYCVAMTIVSIGLYTFGMTLNDLIDRRRDRQIASHRPLPSGRISVRTAHGICVLLGLFAVGGGVWMAMLHRGQWISLIVLLWTMGLIAFYDFAGKYLVATGLLSLGLIRFFHSTIAAPTLAVPWHAIVLLLHVTILSTICYGLEGKRPRLTRGHVATVSLGLMLVVGVLISVLAERVRLTAVPWRIALWWTPGLLYVGAAIATFTAVAITIRVQTPDRRRAGRTIMLYGLLWLIVYDASFVLGYVGWKWALVVAALLPVSMLCVQLTRWWSQLIELAGKPQYQRAR
ncbi:MAG: UbiA family prenyltransferase [Burkholderiales bacterium]|nr:UbiA family prenyltransferase [Phycisphaerae bacterium]